MTELERAAVEIVERTRLEQGKPRRVEDADTINRVAAELLAAPSRARVA